MMPSTVCFGARDDSYGFSRTSKAGNIITFKLTYKSGYVTCHSSNPSYQSKWGWVQNRLIPNQMATLITDKNRNLLLPKSDFLSDYWDCKFYSLPWATTESPQLLFDNFSTPLALETSQEFQIWYSVDLFKWGYGVNGFEKTCVAVYIFEQSPKLQSKLKKRVPKLLFMPLLLQYQITTTHYYMVYLSIYFQDCNPFKIQQLELLHVLGC